MKKLIKILILAAIPIALIAFLHHYHNGCSGSKCFGSGKKSKRRRHHLW